jgi:hypothetical protein
MFIRTAIVAIAMLPAVAACAPQVTGTASPELAAAAAGIIIVDRGEKPSVDLDGSQSLWVRNVTERECDDMGGAWIPTVCMDIDY